MTPRARTIKVKTGLTSVDVSGADGIRVADCQDHVRRIHQHRCAIKGEAEGKKRLLRLTVLSAQTVHLAPWGRNICPEDVAHRVLETADLRNIKGSPLTIE